MALFLLFFLIKKKITIAATTAANPPITPPAIAPEFDFPPAASVPDPAATDDALADADAELAAADDLLEVTKEEDLAPVEEVAAAEVDLAEVETLIPDAARRLTFRKREARKIPPHLEVPVASPAHG